LSPILDTTHYAGAGRGYLGFDDDELVAGSGCLNSLHLILSSLSTQFFELKES
jgi:hypothetical protein